MRWRGLTAAGIDLDPLRVEMAQANLAAAGVGGATMVADATAINLDPFDVAFADPARRTARGRCVYPRRLATILGLHPANCSRAMRSSRPLRASTTG
ncbi:MAG: class I SAM-dependent methyltransferase [Nocardioidaceae bacterium]